MSQSSELIDLNDGEYITVFMCNELYLCGVTIIMVVFLGITIMMIIFLWEKYTQWLQSTYVCIIRIISTTFQKIHYISLALMSSMHVGSAKNINW